MRPIILNYLFSPITILKGLGDKTLKCYEKLLNLKSLEESVDAKTPKIVDLLYHKPYDLSVRRKFPNIFDIKNGESIILKLIVDKHVVPFKNTQPYKIVCHNETGFITIVYFQYKEFVKRAFPENKEIMLSGKAEVFGRELHITHPDYITSKIADNSIPVVEQIYPLTKGITNKGVKTSINEALKKIDDLPEWIDQELVKKEKWPSWKDAINKIHTSEKIKDFDPESKYIQRLAYDELLAYQLALGIIRNKKKKGLNKKQQAIEKKNGLKDLLLASLPFQLTQDQEKVISEIENDIFSDKHMVRLLQGDVGSGKTVVALLTAMSVIENKYQAAFMAPTSILAAQHYVWISEVCKDLKINIALLTGKIKGKQREKIFEDLKSGKIDLLIGTHAIFQENVEFKKLGYVVIDEQHRFGVAQRMSLVKKGESPDILIMTATPIPRTLALTIYGDMNVSCIKEKPQNRKNIETRIILKEKLTSLTQRISEIIKQNKKVYWVCPLVEESEILNLMPVKTRYEEFSKLFGQDKVGLIHGKMKENEKNKIMENFADSEGSIKILIATTVIEVGIDCPNANIMIIEHPERFGLSQLHQLRGRVGRREEQSFCILLYENGISQTSYKRLQIIKNNHDGFYIAEQDLKLRGSGEVLGNKQSGFTEYKIANLYVHYDLLYKASQNAMILLKNVIHIPEKQRDGLRILLYLFNLDTYIRSSLLE